MATGGHFVCLLVKRNCYISYISYILRRVDLPIARTSYHAKCRQRWFSSCSLHLFIDIFDRNEEMNFLVVHDNEENRGRVEGFLAAPSLRLAEKKKKYGASRSKLWSRNLYKRVADGCVQFPIVLFSFFFSFFSFTDKKNDLWQFLVKVATRSWKEIRDN